MTSAGFAVGTLSKLACLLWNIVRLNASAFSQGNFTYGGAHTNDTAADFLLGFLSTYSQSNVQRYGSFNQHWFELYAQITTRSCHGSL